MGIKCEICGYEARDYLGDHVLEAHGMTVAEYLEAHPEAPTMSKRLQDAFSKVSSTRRNHPPKPEELTVDFARATFDVWANVPSEACLEHPAHYRTPTHGSLGEDVQHVAYALEDPECPAVFVHGGAGCGKDAFFHEWSWRCRRPGKMFSVKPGTDIESWFFVHGFDKDGTHYEEGPLLKALRDGYTCADGTVRPYFILFTDIDRADRAQAEYLRLITDSIQGRIDGPRGDTYHVLEGTRIAATANTAGGGDTSGRYVSANPIDTSILDRFEVGIKFHQLDWNDEEKIVRAKFSLLGERCPGIFKTMGRITTALRKAIENEELYAEFSHRALCAILAHATRIVRRSGTIPSDLLDNATRVWVDKLPDDDCRQTAINIMDPLIKGGKLHAGNTSHIQTGHKSLVDNF